MQITIDPTTETPSAAIIKGGNKSATATDKHGRVITVRKLTALDRLRLLVVVGSELSQNDPYMELAFLAFAVSAINGDFRNPAK